MKVAQEREEWEARAQPKRSGDDVEVFLKRWITERLSTRTEGYRAQILSPLERFVWPAIGHKAFDEVEPRDVLEVLEARRSTPNTAEGVQIFIQQRCNYAIQKLIVETEADIERAKPERLGRRSDCRPSGRSQVPCRDTQRGSHAEAVPPSG